MKLGHVDCDADKVFDGSHVALLLQFSLLSYLLSYLLVWSM